MTRINTNVPSLVAQNRLQSSNKDLQTSLTRLSTGLRINSGSDDPAGLIASEALRSEITSLNKAVSNTRRASQIISTADSALGQVSSLLNDIRGLVVEAANSGALSNDEIAANQLQVDSSLEAINRIAQTTTFQGRKLLDGGLDFLTQAGTNFSNIKTLNVDQANLGPSGSLAVSVSVTSAAQQASVTVNNIPTAVAQAKSTGSIALGRTTTDAGSAATLNFSRATTAQQASADFTLGGSGEFRITALDSGAFADGAGNAASFSVAQNAGQTDNVEINTISPGNFEISIKTGATVTLADVEAAFNANSSVNTDFTFAVQNSTGATAVDGAGDVLTAANLADGAAAGTATGSITLTNATIGSAGDGRTVTIAQANGTTTPTVAIDSGTGNVTITVEDTDTVTLDDIATAINTDGRYTAVANTTGGFTSFSGSSNLPTPATTAGGSTAGTATATINLSAKVPGTAANNKTISFNKVNGTTTPTATVTNGNIVINVEDTDSVQIADIVQAINDEGTYEADVTTVGGLTTFDGDTDTSPSTTTTFSGGQVASGGLAEAAVFELLGKTGSEVFNVSAGTSIDDLITQINLVKDATGVTASKTGQNLTLTSNEYGSDSFVDIRVISESSGGTIGAAIGAGARDNGADIVAKVNGVDASGRGNKLSINTSTLDLAITVEDGSDDNFSFTITGGGAQFQLGSDVVSNQQARIGISSVSAARLGGSAGKLFQLGSGESASLANDPNTAARIVTEAINQVTSLRGRLGAFQATTLESNITSLSDTVANLQEAESTIRDADFAKESASLTRAQILVQSGTNVLSLANQNPQNVLSLLR
jgi:flagellin